MVSPSKWSGFEQEKKRAKKWLAKAADALIRRESTVFDYEVREELDMLQPNESTPYVRINNIKKAITAEREEVW